MEAVLTQAINRLEAVLAGETLALEGGDRFGLGEISNRKNQSLLELSRISRGIDVAELGEGTRARIHSLRENLAANSRLLELHMEATAEIAGMLGRALADAEHDGTYAAPSGTRAPAR